MPVFGTMASRFNDDGVTALYQALKPRLAALGLALQPGRLPMVATRHSTQGRPIVPPARVRYLADIADSVRGYKRRALAQAALARELQQLRESARMLAEANPDKHRAREALGELAVRREEQLQPASRQLLAQWPAMQQATAIGTHLELEGVDVEMVQEAGQVNPTVTRLVQADADVKLEQEAGFAGHRPVDKGTDTRPAAQGNARDKSRYEAWPVMAPADVTGARLVLVDEGAKLSQEGGSGSSSAWGMTSLAKKALSISSRHRIMRPSALGVNALS
jgi:hypothetical protein